MNDQTAKVSVDEFMAGYKTGAGKPLPVSGKISVDEFMAGHKIGVPAEEPIGEPAAGPAFVQGQPSTMLERGKEVVTDFFRKDPGLGPLSEKDYAAFEPADILVSDIERQLPQAEPIDTAAQAMAGFTPEEVVTGRPISTITSQPIPTPEEQAQILPAAGRGLVHGLTGVAGTVGTGLEYAGTRTGLEPLKEIGKTTREYWEEKGEGFGPTPYIQGAILEKPELMTKGAWWAYNLADMTPSFAAMMIPGIGAARHIKLAGQALKLTPKVIERLSRIGALTTAGVVGGGMEGAGTYQEILERGGSEEDAAAGMEAMTLAAGALNSIGFGKITGKLGTKKSGALMRFLKAGSWEGLTEYFEEPAEVLIKRGILPDAAFNKDEAIEQLKHGVNVIPVAGVMGGGMSAMMGGAGPKAEPAAPHLSPTQRSLAKEVIREKMAEQPPVPAIPEEPIPIVPPGMPPPVGSPPTGPAPGQLPPGQQGFELVEPAPEVRLRLGPERIEGPEYPEGAEYVAGRPAPEELAVEHKPILSTRGFPWKEKENALKVLRSREDVSLATHKVVKVKKGYGIVPLADKKAWVEAKAKPEKVKGKTLIAFVRAMGGIKDKTLPGEIRTLSPKETGVVGLTTSVPNKGLGFDEMAAAAVEHGWLPENLEDEPGAFSEMLRDDIFTQKEKKPRVERLADVAEKAEREERWKEFERAEDAELEYFAKHPDEEIDTDLDEWQRGAVTEIRSRNEADRARKIEESIARKVEKENPDLGRLKKDEGFSEYIEGWDEKDLLDEEALAELEAWRAGEEVEKPEVEVPSVEKPESEKRPGVPEKKAEKPIAVMSEKPKLEKKPAEPAISPELKELHEHRARTLGFEKAGGNFVEGYLKRLAKVAEKTDMSAAVAAYSALGEYKKGNITQASLEAEKILGKLHKAEKEALMPKPKVEPKIEPKVKIEKFEEITAEMIRAELPEAVRKLPVGRITGRDLDGAAKVLGIRRDTAFTVLKEAEPKEPIKPKPEVKKVEPEKPFEPDLAAMPLGKITVETKALREATGKMVTVKESAKEALARIDEQIEKYKKLLECL